MQAGDFPLPPVKHIIAQSDPCSSELALDPTLNPCKQVLSLVYLLYNIEAYILACCFEAYAANPHFYYLIFYIYYSPARTDKTVSSNW